MTVYNFIFELNELLVHCHNDETPSIFMRFLQFKIEKRLKVFHESRGTHLRPFCVVFYFQSQGF
jgi:hypothetical protein